MTVCAPDRYLIPFFFWEPSDGFACLSTVVLGEQKDQLARMPQGQLLVPEIIRLLGATRNTLYIKEQ